MTKVTAKPKRRRGRQGSRASRTRGKITLIPTRGMIEQRARELAMIAGRPARKVTAGDRREAERQLSGFSKQASTLDDPMPWPGQPWGSPVTSTGRRKRAVRPRDDQNTSRLVEEGVQEAEHSRALAARRAARRRR